MDKIFEWARKNILISFIIGIIVISLPVVLIHILYSIKAPYEFLVSKWSAGELLQFYGAILSFLGTVLLGALALWQNKQLAIKNQEFNEFLNKQQKEMNMPRFDITNQMSSNGDFTNWHINLKNVSENVASGLSVSSFNVYDKEGILICNRKECKMVNNSLQGGEETTIEFKNTALKGEYLIVKFILDYRDKYDEYHSCEVNTKIVNQQFPKNFKFRYIE